VRRGGQGRRPGLRPWELTPGSTRGVPRVAGSGPWPFSLPSRLRSRRARATFSGEGGADDVRTFAGDDFVRAEDTARIWTGDGDDQLHASASSPTTLGDPGTDTLWIALFAGSVVVDLSAGTDAGPFTVAEVENVVGTTGDDTISGDAGPNRLRGGGGADTAETVVSCEG
jgi:Ca2+-binding RTX toxin-like protein